MKTKYLRYGGFLMGVLLLTFFHTYAQENLPNKEVKLHKNTPEILEEVVIEKGTISILSENPPPIKKLIIKGTLIIADDKEILLQVAQLEIDGGTLQVGTNEKEHLNTFAILLNSEDPSVTAVIKIKNKGSILLHGSSENMPLNIHAKPWENPNDGQLQRNITIATYSGESSGFMVIEDATQVKISGVQFKGLGLRDSIPALSWHGQTASPGQINNSVFVDSHYTDLYMDKTSAAIENNIFISKNGNSILCSPSGIGIENNIEANIIFNHSDSDVFAVATKNPYQSITNNYITVKGNTHGIGMLLRPEHENFAWKTSYVSFVMEGNHIEKIIPTAPKMDSVLETKGILIDNFNHTGIWRTKNNTVSYFDKGIIIKSKNVVVEK
ncbi:MAG: G8 domain-containing protein [Saonia sp.]